MRLRKNREERKVGNFLRHGETHPLVPRMRHEASLADRRVGDAKGHAR